MRAEPQWRSMSDSAGSDPLFERPGYSTPDYWRLVLVYFDRNSTQVATLDDLAGFVHEQDSTVRDETYIAIYLHHAALPKIAAHGVVEYDPRSHTARLRVEPAGDGTAAAE